MLAKLNNMEPEERTWAFRETVSGRLYRRVSPPDNKIFVRLHFHLLSLPELVAYGPESLRGDRFIALKKNEQVILEQE